MLYIWRYDDPPGLSGQPGRGASAPLRSHMVLIMFAL